MALLAGLPRIHENRGGSLPPTSALLGAAKPVHQCDAGVLRHPELLLRARIIDSVSASSFRQRPYFHTSLICLQLGFRQRGYEQEPVFSVFCIPKRNTRFLSVSKTSPT